MYKILTDDIHKVIYYSNVQLTDNPVHKSLHLTLPYWERDKE